MKCQGNFVFKSIDFVKEGEFKNSSGELIKYPATYRLSVDEVDLDGKINDVKFKIAESETNLINQLRTLKPYEKISLECSVKFYNNNIKVVPEKVQKLDK